MHKQLSQVRDYLKKNKIPVKTKPGHPAFNRMIKLAILRSQDTQHLTEALLANQILIAGDQAVVSLYSLLMTICEMGFSDKLEEMFDLHHRRLMYGGVMKPVEPVEKKIRKSKSIAEKSAELDLVEQEQNKVDILSGKPS